MTDGKSRWIGRGGRWPRLIASAVLLGSLLTLFGPSTAESIQAAPLTLPAGCPAATSPPAAPYAIQFWGTLSGKVTVQAPGGYVLTVPDPSSGAALSAIFCGLLGIRCPLPSQSDPRCPTLTPVQTATVQPNNIVFSPTTGALGLTKPPLSVLPSGVLAGGILDQASNGGLDLSIQAAAINQAGLLGINCQIGPINLSVTTKGPGGAPLTGPLASGASATLVSSGFTIPVASSTGSGGTCANYIASQIDTLVGLPNSHTTFSTTTTLHVCFIPTTYCGPPTGAAKRSVASPRNGAKR